MKKFSLILFSAVIFFGCSSTPDPIISETQIKVSNVMPMGNCEEIGLLRGTTISVTGAQQNALDDLKQTAINKGANYLKVEEFSETSAVSTGIAYKCN